MPPFRIHIACVSRAAEPPHVSYRIRDLLPASFPTARILQQIPLWLTCPTPSLVVGSTQNPKPPADFWKIIIIFPLFSVVTNTMALKGGGALSCPKDLNVFHVTVTPAGLRRRSLAGWLSPDPRAGSVPVTRNPYHLRFTCVVVEMTPERIWCWKMMGQIESY